MSDPQISIDLARIEHNARTVVDLCRASGITPFGVTKGTCGMPQVARAMLRGGVRGIAESRFENIRRLRDAGIDCPIMLLRSPPLTRVEELVRTVDISLQSELQLMREISRVAERLGRVHDIILMIDLGDLREGIWPNDLVPTVEAILELPGVRIAGVGTNLTCFGAIIPTRENLTQLVAHAQTVEIMTGRPLDWVSGGNSSSLPLLLAGGMPSGINNLRVGEAILQGGRDTFLTEPWQALDRDAFELTGELLEVKTKPSLPIGQSGIDAFGNVPVFVDEGDRLRGIANIGREDVIAEGLIPTRPGVRVLGASSDHLVLDLTEADPPLAVGENVSFRMNYGALLTVMTSEYVEKVPMRDVRETGEAKTYAIETDAIGGALVVVQDVAQRIEHLGFERGAEDADKTLTLSIRARKRDVLPFVEEAGRRHDALGLIWIDSDAAMMPDGEAGLPPPENAVLSRMLTCLPPHIAPENIVLIGLRNAAPEEAAVLKALRLRVFTMAEIDAVGLRQAMRDAITLASAGTRGFHLCYAPTATDMSGWSGGIGGITVRETHSAMEMAALSGKLRSLSISGIDAALPSPIGAECANFILSAFGKTIL
ncbi:alanine racemase [Shinella sp. SUS2]|uniref:alanine racemase n=1 Tax=unclassified Shinella TaxID=2643062 RepID=UPI0006826BE6|nr:MULTISPECIES: alanine racemase [unclassified Shinella]KNY15490.1 alanine racemase [Shinella sp. SUS2]KOC76029.1 alanine racemase [Shinella sp. GWS1]